jgi:LuxR family transcriptional activator of bioluminescence operon
MSDPLTPRQIECLSWAQEGKTAYEMGVILGISTRTVETHLRRAYGSLGVTSRIQAVLRAREAGLLPESPYAQG